MSCKACNGGREMEKSFIKSKSMLNLVLIILIPVLLLIYVRWIRATIPDDHLKNILKSTETLALWLNLFLAAIGLWAGRERILAHIKSISLSSRRKIIIIFLVALLLRAFFAPYTHRLYFDEDLYLNIAQHMVYDGRAVGANFGVFLWDNYVSYDDFLNKQPNAYPALVSIFFMIFGVHEIVATILSIFLSSLTVIVLFLFVTLLYGEAIALWASLFLSLVPVAVVYATTTSTETPLAFFIILTMYLFALFAKDPSSDFRVACAAFFTLAFAAQFRPEAVILFALVFLFLVLFDRRLFDDLRDMRMVLIWLPFGILIAHHCLHVLGFMHENWGAVNQDKFGVAYVSGNLKDNLRFFVKNREFPLAFTLCAIIGLFSYIRKWKEKLLIASWFVIFFIPYLFFYAGSYNYGVDVRFSLMMLCPVSILCALGMGKVREALERLIPGSRPAPYLAALLILLFIPHMPYIRDVHEESWDARLDHDFIISEARNLPRDAVIFTCSPYVIVLGPKRSALQSYFAEDDKMVDKVFSMTDHVYYYREYWSYAPVTRHNYEYFRQKFAMEPLSSVEFFQRDYTLYRIWKK